MSKYARIGPPFNFLGHLTESQKEEFEKWVNARKTTFVKNQEFYQIRAQQLRKSAGLLEKFYDAGKLNTTFEKDAWKPGSEGHFPYTTADDHTPMVTVSKIKTALKAQLEVPEEAIFFMGWLRNTIEKCEDNAVYASEAEVSVTKHLEDLNSQFQKPQYQAALVRDKTDLYKGEARFRVNQLDEPKKYELDVVNRDVKE